MSEQSTEREPDPRILAELSALADGTLDPGRAERLRELIAESPELRARYDRERSAVLTLQALSADRAPANLRIAIETRRQRVSRRRSRPLFGFSLAAGAAVAALLLALLLPGGTLGGPTVSQAATLALRGAARPAPASQGVKLRLNVGRVYFPNWSSLGWKPSGWRTDRLGGKLAATVYYRQWNGEQVAYTILTSPPLRWPESRTIHLDGIALQSFISHGRLVVTWRRAGHTCLLSGTGVGTSELARLAGWEVPLSVS